MWTTPDGYVLHLPLSGLTKILARLPDSGLNGLMGSSHNGNVMHGVVDSIGQLARMARRAGNVRHAKSHEQYALFTAPAREGKYQILARPLSVRQSAIVFVCFEPAPVSPPPENGKHIAPQAHLNGRYHPAVLKSTEILKPEAGKIFFRAYPRLRGQVEIHHRFPLEFRRLFPKADPNRLSNLIGLRTAEQARQVKGMWEMFVKACRRRRRNPSAKEVLQYVRRVDWVLFRQFS